MTRLTPRLLAVLILILGLGSGLRIFRLEARSLWYDEAFAVLFAEKGVSAMLYGTLTPVAGGAADIHPLLYYTTLNLWMQAAGQSVLVVRLWSVFWGLLCIALAYRLARELWDVRVGLWAALLVAVFPFHIHYSQETRMYTLLCALLLGAAVCYVRALRPGQGMRLRWWIGFGICAGLAMYTQQLAAFTLIAVGLAALATRRRSVIIGMAIGTILALILYAPWLTQIPSQLQKINSYYWVDIPTILTLFRSHVVFLTVYAESHLNAQTFGCALALILLTVILALLRILTRRSRRSDRERETYGVQFIAWLWLAPILLMWGFSQKSPVYLERALIFSAVMLYLFIAWTLARSRGPLRLVMLALSVYLVGVGLMTQYSMMTFPYSPLRQTMACIRDQWQAGDRVVHHVKLSMLPGVYYARDLDQHYIGDEPGSAQDTLALPTQEMLHTLADPTLEAAVGDAMRVWFVVYARAEGEVEDLTIMRDTLSARYGSPTVYAFSDLNVYAYGEGFRECVGAAYMPPEVE